MRKAILSIIVVLLTTLGVSAQTVSMQISAYPTFGGTVSPSGTASYAVGSTVACTATPRTDYKFVNWILNGEVYAETSAINFVVPANGGTLTANFEYTPGTPNEPESGATGHTISATANPENGGTVSIPNRELREGETAVITATPNDKYKFVSWTLGGQIVGTNSKLTVVVGKENLSYIANFEYVPSANEILIDSLINALNTTVVNLEGLKESIATVATTTHFVDVDKIESDRASLISTLNSDKTYLSGLLKDDTQLTATKRQEIEQHNQTAATFISTTPGNLDKYSKAYTSLQSAKTTLSATITEYSATATAATISAGQALVAEVDANYTGYNVAKAEEMTASMQTAELNIRNSVGYDDASAEIAALGTSLSSEKTKIAASYTKTNANDIKALGSQCDELIKTNADLKAQVDAVVSANGVISDSLTARIAAHKTAVNTFITNAEQTMPKYETAFANLQSAKATLSATITELTGSATAATISAGEALVSEVNTNYAGYNVAKAEEMTAKIQTAELNIRNSVGYDNAAAEIAALGTSLSSEKTKIATSYSKTNANDIKALGNQCDDLIKTNTDLKAQVDAVVSANGVISDSLTARIAAHKTAVNTFIANAEQTMPKYETAFANLQSAKATLSATITELTGSATAATISTGQALVTEVNNNYTGYNVAKAEEMTAKIQTAEQNIRNSVGYDNAAAEIAALGTSLSSEKTKIATSYSKTNANDIKALGNQCDDLIKTNTDLKAQVDAVVSANGVISDSLTARIAAHKTAVNTFITNADQTMPKYETAFANLLSAKATLSATITELTGSATAATISAGEALVTEVNTNYAGYNVAKAEEMTAKIQTAELNIRNSVGYDDASAEIAALSTSLSSEKTKIAASYTKTNANDIKALGDQCDDLIKTNTDLKAQVDAVVSANGVISDSLTARIAAHKTAVNTFITNAEQTMPKYETAFANLQSAKATLSATLTEYATTATATTISAGQALVAEVNANYTGYNVTKAEEMTASMQTADLNIRNSVGYDDASAEIATLGTSLATEKTKIATSYTKTNANDIKALDDQCDDLIKTNTDLKAQVDAVISANEQISDVLKASIAAHKTAVNTFITNADQTMPKYETAFANLQSAKATLSATLTEYATTATAATISAGQALVTEVNNNYTGYNVAKAEEMTAKIQTAELNIRNSVGYDNAAAEIAALGTSLSSEKTKIAASYTKTNANDIKALGDQCDDLIKTNTDLKAQVDAVVNANHQISDSITARIAAHKTAVNTFITNADQTMPKYETAFANLQSAKASLSATLTEYATTATAATISAGQSLVAEVNKDYTGYSVSKAEEMTVSMQTAELNIRNSVGYDDASAEIAALATSLSNEKTKIATSYTKTNANDIKALGEQCDDLIKTNTDLKAQVDAVVSANGVISDSLTARIAAHKTAVNTFIINADQTMPKYETAFANLQSAKATLSATLTEYATTATAATISAGQALVTEVNANYTGYNVAKAEEMTASMQTAELNIRNSVGYDDASAEIAALGTSLSSEKTKIATSYTKTNANDIKALGEQCDDLIKTNTDLKAQVDAVVSANGVISDSLTARIAAHKTDVNTFITNAEQTMPKYETAFANLQSAKANLSATITELTGSATAATISAGEALVSEVNTNYAGYNVAKAEEMTAKIQTAEQNIRNSVGYDDASAEIATLATSLSNEKTKIAASYTKTNANDIKALGDQCDDLIKTNTDLKAQVDAVVNANQQISDSLTARIAAHKTAVNTFITNAEQTMPKYETAFANLQSAKATLSATITELTGSATAATISAGEALVSEVNTNYAGYNVAKAEEMTAKMQTAEQNIRNSVGYDNAAAEIAALGTSLSSEKTKIAASYTKTNANDIKALGDQCDDLIKTNTDLKAQVDAVVSANGVISDSLTARIAAHKTAVNTFITNAEQTMPKYETAFANLQSAKASLSATLTEYATTATAATISAGQALVAEVNANYTGYSVAKAEEMTVSMQTAELNIRNSVGYDDASAEIAALATSLSNEKTKIATSYTKTNANDIKALGNQCDDLIKTNTDLKAQVDAVISANEQISDALKASIAAHKTAANTFIANADQTMLKYETAFANLRSAKASLSATLTEYATTATATTISAGQNLVKEVDANYTGYNVAKAEEMTASMQTADLNIRNSVGYDDASAEIAALATSLSNEKTKIAASYTKTNANDIKSLSDQCDDLIKTNTDLKAQVDAVVSANQQLSDALKASIAAHKTAVNTFITNADQTMPKYETAYNELMTELARFADEIKLAENSVLPSVVADAKKLATDIEKEQPEYSLADYENAITNISDMRAKMQEYEQTDDVTLALTEAGTLADNIANPQGVISLTVSGLINGTDVNFIRERLPNIESLNFTKARIMEGGEPATQANTINDEMFADMTGLNKLLLPETVENIGKSFIANTDISDITIPASTKIVSEGALNATRYDIYVKWQSVDARVPNLNGNPNLMVYAVTGTKAADSTDVNIINDGVAEKIVLHNGNDLYVPEEFKAKDISYGYEFTKKTQQGASAGWETIVLPFNVQRFKDAEGYLTPFGYNAQHKRNFWLAEMTDNGFAFATEIVANTPYIICMPNNDEYKSGTSITGNISFANIDTDGVTVQRTKEARTVYGPEYAFSVAYKTIPQSQDVFVLNDDIFDEYMPGGVFVKAGRDVRPFEAYLTPLNSNAANRRFVPVIGNAESDGIQGVHLDSPLLDASAIYDLSGRRTSTISKGFNIIRKSDGTVIKVRK